MIQATRLALVGAIVWLSCAGARGAQIAFDSTGDSAYNNGWTQGSNGGFGWGSGWNISLIAPAQALIGDSTTNGFSPSDGDGDINSPRAVGGRAWGLTSGGAARAFSSPLSLGQTFSIDFDDNGGFSLNYQSSVYLLAPGGAGVVGVRANIPTHYQIDTAAGRIDTGVPDTSEGIHIDFTELSSGVQVSITPYTAGATTTTIIAPYTGQVSAVEFVSVNAGLSAPAQQIPYINNMSITPEPSGLRLLALALPGLAARRRRR